MGAWGRGFTQFHIKLCCALHCSKQSSISQVTQPDLMEFYDCVLCDGKSFLSTVAHRQETNQRWVHWLSKCRQELCDKHITIQESLQCGPHCRRNKGAYEFCSALYVYGDATVYDTESFLRSPLPPVLFLSLTALGIKLRTPHTCKAGVL